LTKDRLELLETEEDNSFIYINNQFGVFLDVKLKTLKQFEDTIKYFLKKGKSSLRLKSRGFS
jgi:hypothetical protein